MSSKDTDMKSNIPDSYDILMKTGESELSACLFTLLEDGGTRVTWETTGRCNVGCKHCCIDATAQKSSNCELSLEQAKEVTRQMVDRDVTGLYISGGEPFLWKPLRPYINDAKQQGIDLVSVATNGLMVTPESARMLSEAGTDKILLSLDSHRREVHDDFRGRSGLYDKVISAMSYLKDQGISTRLGAVIWSGNVDELRDMAQSMYELGADEMAWSWLMKAGRAAQHPEIWVSGERYWEIGRTLDSMKSQFKGKMGMNYHRFKPISDETIGCQGGVRFLHISPEGYVSPCSWITKIAPQYVSQETVYNSTLDRLLREEPIQRFREMVDSREAEYGPGCPAVCLIENGTVLSYDPVYAIKR